MSRLPRPTGAIGCGSGNSIPKIMRREMLIGAVLALLVGGAAGEARAQLRPLDPLPAGALDPAGQAVSARIGFGVLQGQRAALAGTEGRLVEVGNFHAFWRTGRVALEIGGTPLRLFEDRERFDEPEENVAPNSGPDRRDAGDYRIATSVRLTPEEWPTIGYVRFGTRLPTTDNTTGLDRDRTDFFGGVGAHHRAGRWTLAGESGIGIYGTRHYRLEQSDVLTYAVSAEYDAGPVAPSVMVLGHADGMDDRAIRGSEELAEVRAGLRVGGRVWLSAQWVHGLTDFSPSGGLLLEGGWGI